MYSLSLRINKPSTKFGLVFLHFCLGKDADFKGRHNWPQRPDLQSKNWDKTWSWNSFWGNYMLHANVSTEALIFNGCKTAVLQPRKNLERQPLPSGLSQNSDGENGITCKNAMDFAYLRVWPQICSAGGPNRIVKWFFLDFPTWRNFLIMLGHSGFGRELHSTSIHFSGFKRMELCLGMICWFQIPTQPHKKDDLGQVTIF